MAVRRSPPKSTITCPDSNEMIAIRCESQSQPDLRQLIQSDPDINKVTFRKRKTPDDDLSDKFDNFESKIMAILTKMSETQTDKLDKISQQISMVTNQISQIKSTTDHLSAEQNKIKVELKKIETSKVDLEKKVHDLTIDYENFKISAFYNNAQPAHLMQGSTMVSEIHDRIQRERNIVISGIPEMVSRESTERTEHDKKEVNKIIKLADPNCREPTKCFRLGKYSKEKSRPIKVCFASADIVKSILRNKNNIDKEIANIKCYSDQTPMQKEELLKLRAQLNERTEKGEQNLVIKYIKGIPKIIEAPPKN